MTPRQVDELSVVEYSAFWKYADRKIRAQEREQRRQARRRR